MPKRNPPNIVRDGLIYKWCGHCKGYLPADYFHPSKHHRDGLRPYCKEYDSKASSKSRQMADEAYEHILKGEFVHRDTNVLANWKDYFPQLVSINQGLCPQANYRWSKGLDAQLAHAHTAGEFEGHICFNPLTIGRVGPWVEGGFPSETLIHEYAHLLSKGDGHYAVWKQKFKEQLARFGYKIPHRINRFRSCHAGHISDR